MPPGQTQQSPAEGNAAQTTGQADRSHQARWWGVLQGWRHAAVPSPARAPGSGQGTHGEGQGDSLSFKVQIGANNRTQEDVSHSPHPPEKCTYLSPRFPAFSWRGSGGDPCWRWDSSLWVVILPDRAAAVLAQSPPQWKEPAHGRHSSCSFFSADRLHILGGTVRITADVSYGRVSGR